MPDDVARIVCPVGSAIAFDTALAEFRGAIELLFGTVAARRRGDLAFFPGAIRNPIMDAGVNLTLLD